MTDDEIRTAVRATLAVLTQLAQRTRTPADDLLVQLLRQNEARLVTAIADLLRDPAQPPTAERVTSALAAVGIRA
jgi:hypothetical protein